MTKKEKETRICSICEKRVMIEKGKKLYCPVCGRTTKKDKK